MFSFFFSWYLLLSMLDCACSDLLWEQHIKYHGVFGFNQMLCFMWEGNFNYKDINLRSLNVLFFIYACGLDPCWSRVLLRRQMNRLCSWMKLVLIPLATCPLKHLAPTLEQSPGGQRTSPYVCPLKAENHVANVWWTWWLCSACLSDALIKKESFHCSIASLWKQHKAVETDFLYFFRWRLIISVLLLKSSWQYLYI